MIYMGILCKIRFYIICNPCNIEYVFCTQIFVRKFDFVMLITALSFLFDYSIVISNLRKFDLSCDRSNKTDFLDFYELCLYYPHNRTRAIIHSKLLVRET